MKWLPGLLFLLVATAVVMADEALSADALNRLLRSLSETRKPSMEVHFIESQSLELLTEPLVSSGRLRFLAPNYFSKEITSPSPSRTYFDGSHLWIVFPDQKAAECYPADRNQGILQSLRGLSAALTLQDLEKSFRVGGWKVPEGYRLELIPKDRRLRRSLQRISVYLSGERKLSAIVLEARNGDTSRMDVVSERAVSLTPQDFRYQPEKGFKVSYPLGR